MKALALFSGGLDSLLAVKLIQETGVEVEAVYFLQPFLQEDEEKRLIKQLRKLIDQVGAELHIVRLGEEYLRMLESPKHGYGKAFNPCLDCHIFFLKEAGKLMRERGASFLVTGEVVGQRPKSQYRGAFPIIDREVGLEGLIVRPLSAGLLPRTIPEEKGWISLTHCPSIQGRQRKIQMELAEKYGLEYAPPAGGCLLTNTEYGRKVSDLLRHNKRLEVEPMRLLTVGRHFRFSPGFKGIIGRDRNDNRKLFRYFCRRRRNPELFLVKAGRVPGPLAIGFGSPSEEDLKNLALLTARYSDHKEGENARVRLIRGGTGRQKTELNVIVTKSPSLMEKYRIT